MLSYGHCIGLEDVRGPATSRAKERGGFQGPVCTAGMKAAGEQDQVSENYFSGPLDLDGHLTLAVWDQRRSIFPFPGTQI